MAVVIGPPHEVATIRSVQVVALGGDVALVVVVLSNGVVDRHTIDIDPRLSDVELNAASARSWAPTAPGICSTPSG